MAPETAPARAPAPAPKPGPSWTEHLWDWLRDIDLDTWFARIPPVALWIAVVAIALLLLRRLWRAARPQPPTRPPARPPAQPRTRATDAVSRRPCRWKRDKWRPAASLDRWVCTRCGVDAYSSDGRPPKECKRELRETAL